MSIAQLPPSAAPQFPAYAPFSADQQAWLAGFLAGMQASAGAGTPSTADAPPLHVWFGTQTGNAEGVAGEVAAAASAAGMNPVVASLDDVGRDELLAARTAVIVVSTYGEGEMPDSAELFWEQLSASDAPRLEELSYAVLALGDSGYDGFCQAGKLLDTRFEQLGAERLAARVDCDVDFEDPAAAWAAEVVETAAVRLGARAGAGTTRPASGGARDGRPKWGRKNPYASRLVVNRVLSGTGSAKENRHLEFDLADSQIAYEAGDAMAVVPRNDPALVDAVLKRLGSDGSDAVEGRSESLGEALTSAFEISTPSKDLLAALGERARDAEVRHLLLHGERAAVEEWLWGRDLLDLLALADFEREEVVGWLRPLQHRQYSISSSPLAHAGRVHLTVAAVRYQGREDGRARGGVCSTYLCDRLAAEDPVGIFMTPNAAFRLPADDVPIVMVGPGTGIAPFRGFLHERAARGAQGRNWLFFGDQHRAHDFAYEDELTQLSDAGTLSRLDLAFSRDQGEKVYVQHRMVENGRDLYAWLEEGAHFYVCGDASRMAKDVDDALHRVIVEHGGRDAEGAAAYVADLKRAKRYARDVY